MNKRIRAMTDAIALSLHIDHLVCTRTLCASRVIRCRKSSHSDGRMLPPFDGCATASEYSIRLGMSCHMPLSAFPFSRVCSNLPDDHPHGRTEYGSLEKSWANRQRLIPPMICCDTSDVLLSPTILAARI